MMIMRWRAEAEVGESVRDGGGLFAYFRPAQRGAVGIVQEVRAGRSANSVALRRSSLAMVWPSIWAATDG